MQFASLMPKGVAVQKLVAAGCKFECAMQLVDGGWTFEEAMQIPNVEEARTA